MMRRVVGAAVCAAALIVSGCPGGSGGPAPSGASAGGAPLSAADLDQAHTIAKSLFGALPQVAESAKNPVTDAKVELGRLLYHDVRLSKNHDVSCNSCHDLARFGVDGEATSPGHKGQRGGRNSPTVYNAALQSTQFWDGRAADVEEQAIGPILNPIEMAMPSEEAVLTVLRSIPGYAEKFEAAFPEEAEPLTYPNVGKAIGAFERKLMTPGPFDEFVQGKKDALTPIQAKGLKTFIDTGCGSCHMGPNLGGTVFQKLGLVAAWPSKDAGRFEVTKNESDKGMFKTSPLRNVTKTGPYLHDGSMANLEEVVDAMAARQLGKTLSDAQRAEIMAFLDALTGTPPADLVAAPEPLPSGPDTPKPDPN